MTYANETQSNKTTKMKNGHANRIKNKKLRIKGIRKNNGQRLSICDFVHVPAEMVLLPRWSFTNLNGIKQQLRKCFKILPVVYLW